MVAFFGLFRIQLNEFFASSPFKAMGTVKRIGEVVLERGEQERPELPLESIHTRKRALLQQMEEKPLSPICAALMTIVERVV